MVRNMDRIYKGTTGIIYRAVDTPLASGGEESQYEKKNDNYSIRIVYIGDYDWMW